MDKNQLLGAILISLAIVTYINFFHSKKNEKNTQKKEIEIQNDFDKPISQKNKLTHSNFIIKEQTYILENSNMKIVFTNKGGIIKEIFLKKYKDSKNNPLQLLNSNSSQMGFEFNFQDNLYNTYDLDFELVSINSDKIIFKANIEDGQYILQQYSLKKGGIYELSYSLKFHNLKNKIKESKINFVWKNNLIPLETDLERSKEKATINYCYKKNDKFKALKVKQKEKSEKSVSEPLKWITMKQRFFTSGIIAEKSIKKAYIYTLPSEKKDIVKQAYMDLEFSLKDNETIKFNFFFGPNEYDILKKVTKGFSNNLFTGWSIVKNINKYFTTPLFSILSKYIHSHGLLIIILVLIIKLLLLPLSFKSQISTSKMKVLKPELDKIKEKYKNEKQKIQMAQVALYKDMGVNPLSGCIPILLQMPILIAMFNFFPNAIEFRQATFLWVKDLSTYDSILTLPFSIPLYGNHVSLFALLMTASTILMSIFNSQVSSDVDPSMKVFTYFMPIMFMVILNSHPAALSFYYFVSNILSIFQQYAIGKMINEEEIKRKLLENKNKPNTHQKPRSISRLEKMLDKKKKK